MKSVIALDIGGVCIRLYPEKVLAFAGWSSFPREMIPWEHRLECGLLTWEEWCRHCRPLLPENRRDISDEALQEVFCRMIGGDFPGMAEQCRRWKKEGRTLVLFSNTSEIHCREVWRKFSFGDCIDGAVYSYEAGAMKPHEAMYRAFEEKYGVPEIYLDDRQENIDGARARGWQALLFNGTDCLKNIRLTEENSL